MQIRLSNEWAEFVRKKIKNGDFESAECLVCEALRLLRSAYDEHAAKRRELEGMVAEGIQDLEEGRVVEDFSMEDFIANGRWRETS